MVGHSYKLKVSLPDTLGDDITPYGTGLLAVVPPSTFAGGSGCSLAGLQSSKRTVQIDCVDETGALANDPAGLCSYTMAFAEGPQNGGHNDATHALGRPFAETFPQNDPSTQVPMSGGTSSVFVYMPEVAGDVAVNIGGRDPYGGTLTADPLIFEVKLKELNPMNIAGLNFVIDSHPGDGQAAISTFTTAMQEAISEYKATVQPLPIFPAPNNIIGTGASLNWGGLFDTEKNWSTPHCGHRDGRALDIDWTNLTLIERKALADVVNNSQAIKFYPKESPGAVDKNGKAVDHWHVMAH